MTAQLQLEAVEARFGGTAALRGVDLTIGSGVTALVGRNGAGKTTLIRVVTGTVRPAGGRVLRMGRDVFADRAGLREHRRSLGWLPQEPGFPTRMTVERLLAYAAWLKELPSDKRGPAVNAALELADLEEKRSHRIGTLSGGQRRRVALAAATVGDPSLVLLDEPTNGLDPVQRSRLLARVRASGEAGRTILVATHLLEDVALVADRWLAIDRGKVVTSGSIDRTSNQSVSRGVETIREAISGDPG